MNEAITIPIKPLYGQPCNGCGWCCAQEVCGIGQKAFPGAVAPCPALKLSPDRKRTICAIVATEAAAGMEPLIANALGIGKGCCADDPRPNHD